MFPAPTTTASWVPAWWTPTISSEIATTVFGSIPYSRPPRSASPDSLSSARRNGVPPALGVACATSSVLVVTSRFPACECGGVWGTGRFPTFSRRRGHAGETWFPPRPRAEGERSSRGLLLHAHTEQALARGERNAEQYECEPGDRDGADWLVQQRGAVEDREARHQEGD